jgi:hypothetical protein
MSKVRFISKQIDKGLHTKTIEFVKNRISKPGIYNYSAEFHLITGPPRHLTGKNLYQPRNESLNCGRLQFLSADHSLSFLLTSRRHTCYL